MARLSLAGGASSLVGATNPVGRVARDLPRRRIYRRRHADHDAPAQERIARAADPARRDHRRRHVGDRHGRQAQDGRHRVVPPLRAAGRPRRHLARQHLPGAALRRRVALLPVHLRARTRTGRQVNALGARDLGVPERGRRPLRDPRAHVVSHARDGGRVGRRGLAPALRRRSRGGVRLHRHRRRRARAHQEARPGGAGDVRRRRVPLGRVGPLGRAGGQADRRDRHRLDGDADHPRARAGRAPLQALPAHAAVDLPGAQPPLHALGQMAVPPVPGAQQRRVPRLAAGLRGDVRTGGHQARPRDAR